jgi:hypothetical protein
MLDVPSDDGKGIGSDECKMGTRISPVQRDQQAIEIPTIGKDSDSIFGRRPQAVGEHYKWHVELIDLSYQLTEFWVQSTFSTGDAKAGNVCT